LSRADQEKGRLRTFLLGSLQNFLLKERERLRALKRGGAHQFVSFDEQLPQSLSTLVRLKKEYATTNNFRNAWVGRYKCGNLVRST
jgi:hypothetical protein